MKIRIKGNSVRLRLSQTELEEFADKGMVSESIVFGQNPIQKLTYSLISSGIEQVSARFSNNTIELFIPHNLSKEWSSSDMVSLQNNIKIDEQNSLNVLIEKDFQCLHKRPGEDEADNFPNPLAEQNLR